MRSTFPLGGIGSRFPGAPLREPELAMAAYFIIGEPLPTTRGLRYVALRRPA